MNAKKRVLSIQQLATPTTPQQAGAVDHGAIATGLSGLGALHLPEPSAMRRSNASPNSPKRSFPSWYMQERFLALSAALLDDVHVS